jgi:hypothetical protein
MPGQRYHANSWPASPHWPVEDTHGTARLQAFFAAASEPKQERRYDTGHQVNDVAAYADRARFLADNLDMPTLPDVLAKRIC